MDEKLGVFVEELEIPIRNLVFGKSSRHDEGHIDRIAESIALNGLMNPILVHPVDKNKWRVDAGDGRIQAHIRLGRKTIRARVYQDSPIFNQLRHIDENIARVEVNSFEWDRLVAERIEIVKKLDPNNRIIRDAIRPPKRAKSKPNDSKGLDAVGNATVADALRQNGNAVQAVAAELGCSPRKVAQAKARTEKATPNVAAAHADGRIMPTQVDELIKIKDPVVQDEVAARVVGKTKEETKEIVADVIKPPSERLDVEMTSAVKLASALTTRLQTIKRLMEVEGLTPSDVTRARFTDAIEGLKICLG